MQFALTQKQRQYIIDWLSDKGIWDIGNQTIVNVAKLGITDVGLFAPIYTYLSGLFGTSIDRKISYWFSKAPYINSDTRSDPAANYIRAVTQYGLELNGKVSGLTQAQIDQALQLTSNLIGANVIQGILTSGGIADFPTVLSGDISAAIGNQDLSLFGHSLQQTVGGWGGAFYYWQQPVQLTPWVVSVGAAIMRGGIAASPTPSEAEFYWDNANAAADFALSERNIALGSLGFVGSLKGVLSGFQGGMAKVIRDTLDAVTSGSTAESPGSVKATLAASTVGVLIGRALAGHFGPGPHTTTDGPTALSSISVHADGTIVATYSDGGSYTQIAGSDKTLWSDAAGDTGSIEVRGSGAIVLDTHDVNGALEVAYVNPDNNLVYEKGDGARAVASASDQNILYGGAGRNDYVVQALASGAKDTIVDSDGVGTIAVDSTTLSGGAQVAGQTFAWSDSNGDQYQFVPWAPGSIVGDLLISGGRVGAGRIEIDGFDLGEAETNSSGYLGIHFAEQVAIVPGEGSDPFANGSNQPANAAATTPGKVQGLTVFASVSGDSAQTVKLTLNGGDASLYKINTGAGLIDFTGDSVTLSIPADSDRITVGLLYLGDPTQSQTVQLTSTLLDSGSPVSNTLTVTFDNSQSPHDPVFNDNLVPIEGQDFTTYTKYEGDDAGDLITVTGNGHNAITAGNGNNSISGGTGQDEITVGGGNNVINASGGPDLIFTGAGHNIINANGGQDIIYAGNGSNAIYGGSRVDLNTALQQQQEQQQKLQQDGQNDATHLKGDIVTVGQGNNTLVGGLGNDLFMLGNGNNLVVAGPGDDTLMGGVLGQGITRDWFTQYVTDADGTKTWQLVNAGYVSSGGMSAGSNYEGNYLTGSSGTPVGVGNDTIFGGSGNHLMFLSNGNNYVDAGSGNSTVQGGMGDDTIFGGAGSDSLFGGGGNDYIDAESGNDFVSGGAGNNTIYGGSGKSTIFAGDAGANWATAQTGSNYVEAGTGQATVYGSGGNDTLIAGDGGDYMQAGDGNEVLIGGDGSDTLIGGNGTTTIYAGDGGTADQPTHILLTGGASTVYGGDGVDQIQGGSGTAVIYAGNGGDETAQTIVQAGSGNTTIHGGAGVDILKGGSGTNVIYAGDGGTAAHATQVQAGSGNTTIYGGAGVDQLVGGSGNDLIHAGDGGTVDTPTIVQGSLGNDTLAAGGGVSQLIAGAGGHTTVLLDATNGSTTIFGDSEVLTFAKNVLPQDVSMSAQLYSDGKSALVIAYGDGAQATVMGGLTGSVSEVVYLDPENFTLSQAMREAYIERQSLQGNGFDLIMSGDEGDRLVGTTGNDTLIGVGANDTLEGSIGNVYMMGGGGNAVYKVNTRANTTIAYSVGSDTLVFGADAMPTDLHATKTTAVDGSFKVTIHIAAAGSVEVDSGVEGALSTIQFADEKKISLSDLIENSASGPQRVYNADGTYVEYTTDASGKSFQTTYSAEGVKLSDVWTQSDGTHGSDFFYGNGSSSGTSFNVDGTYSKYTNDGQGHSVTYNYDAHGNLLSIDGSDPSHVSTLPGGGQLIVSTNPDGSTSSQTVNPDGTSSSTVLNSDGSVSTITSNPTLGVTVTHNVSWNGVAGLTQITQTNGGNTVTTLRGATGAKVGETFTRNDGSSGTDHISAYDFVGEQNYAALSTPGTPYKVSWGLPSRFEADIGWGFVDVYGTDWQGSPDLVALMSKGIAAEVQLSHFFSQGPDTSGRGPADISLGDTFDNAPPNMSRGDVQIYDPLTGVGIYEFQNQQGGKTVLGGAPAYSYQTPTLPQVGGAATASTPIEARLQGLDGTTATFYDDGQGNGELVGFDSQGRRIDDLWWHNDGTIGVDQYFADGTFKGLVSAPTGLVTTYTGSGSTVYGTYTHDPKNDIPTGPPAPVNTHISSGGPSPTTPAQGPNWFGNGWQPSQDGQGGTWQNYIGPDGAIHSIHKDSAGNVLNDVTVKTDPGFTAAAHADGATFSWDFDVDGTPTSRTKDDGSGTVVTEKLDAAGQAVSRTISVTGKDGVTSTRTYDAAGRLTGCATITSTVADGVTTKTSSLQDAAGHGIGTIILVSDSRGNSVTTRYDATGALQATTDVTVTATNASISTDYDAAGHPGGSFTSVVESTGAVQTSTYDGNGDVTGTTVATQGSSGQVSTASYDATGQLTGYVILSTDTRGDTVFDAYGATGTHLRQFALAPDGVQTNTTYNTDGSSEATQVAIDGSYTVAAQDAEGGVVTTHYAASGEKRSDTWTRPDGSSGSDTFNADGSVDGTVTYADGTRANIFTAVNGGVTTTHYAVNGTETGTSETHSDGTRTTVTNLDASGVKLSDHWVSIDGSSGSDTYAANGSSSSMVTHAGGASDITANDGQGNVLTKHFDAGGTLLSDSWSHADGSRGSDTYAADGSSISTTTHPDGTTDSITIDGHGDVLTKHIDAAGTLLSDSWTHADGSTGSDTYAASGSFTHTRTLADDTSETVTGDGKGNTLTQYFDASGTLMGDSWQHADGSKGSDIFESTMSEVMNPDGTSDSVSNDGQGHVLRKHFDASGTLVSDSWTYADGSYGSDTYAADGSFNGTATLADGTTETITGVKHPDGTSDTVADDGQGNVLTKHFDAWGTLVGDSWAHADGSSGSDVINGDGSRYSSTVTDTSGRTTTTLYTAQGTPASDTWTATDGSYGSDSYYSNGSVRSTVTEVNPDGSSKTTTVDANGSSNWVQRDAQGHAVADFHQYADGSWWSYTYHYTDDGFEDADTWEDSRGRHGSDTYNPDGTGTSISVGSDGVEYDYVNGLNGDTWTASDGTHGSDEWNWNGPDSWGGWTGYNADGSFSINSWWVGESFTFDYDSSGKVLDESWRGQPQGSSGTTTFNSDGTISGTVTDSQGHATSFDHEPEAVGVAAAVQNQAIAAGNPWTFRVPAATFQDANPGEFFQYSATLANGDALSSWLTFNPHTRTFSGTPPEGVDLAVRVTVVDSVGLQASSVFALSPDGEAHAPVVNEPIAGQSAKEAQPWTFAVPAATFADADTSDLLTMSATLADGSALPSWLSFDASTGIFTGTPPAGVGSLALQVTAQDSFGYTASTVFDVQIAPAIQIVTGTSGNDSLTGSANDDRIDGLAGNDTMHGLGGNDRYVVDSAGDVVIENAGEGNDTIESAVTYTLPANVEALFLTGTAAISATGNGASNELVGNAAANTLNGGAGADRLVGGDGDDTYVVENAGDSVVELPGEGKDTVQASVSYTLSANVENLTLTQSNLIGTGNELNNVLVSAGNNGTLNGGAGDDVLGIAASSTSATYIGGAGQDTINGGYQSDTFMFNPGDGQDTINDFSGGWGGTDVLQFGQGIAPADVTVVRSGEDVIFKVGVNGDQVTFKKWFNESHGYYQAQQVKFADGTVWTQAQINAPLLDLFGTTGNDSLVGVAAFAETLHGAAGNDTLTAVGNGDILDGGAGDDVLRVNDIVPGGTTFIGGTGNDTITGWYQSDTFMFNPGDGQDTINDFSGGWGGTDVLQFGQGIAPADVTVVRSGEDVIFKVGAGGDQVTFKKWFNESHGYYQAQQVKFADGTIWTQSQLNAPLLDLFGTAGNDSLVGVKAFAETLHGAAGNDTLTAVGNGDVLDGGAGDDVLRVNDIAPGGTTFIGGTGNDTITGWYQSDTFMFNPGDGQDTINDFSGGWGGTDVLQFGQGIAPADVTVVRSGEDVIFKVGVNGDQVTFKKWFNESHGYYQPQQIKLADGTIWTQSQLNAQLLDMSGTAGNDSLVGVAAFAETLHGAAGNDTLTAVGDGDILDGGAGDDVLGVNGMPSGTTFVGGQGNDAITGSYLSDTYVFNSGDGQDTITDFNGGWTATDVLQLGPDIAADQIWFQKVGNNLQISIIGTTDSITVANWYSDARYHIEVIQLANGQKLLDSHVQNLVQVMGSLTLPSLGQTTLSADYQTQLEPTIAANWQ